MLRAGLAIVVATTLVSAPARVASAATTTQTFTAVADSYVSQGSPNTNYGTKTTLRALASSPTQRSYLRFNVQGLVGSVSRATLQLYTRSSSSVGYAVRAVADTSWGEKTLTYNNAPAVSATVTGSSGSFSSSRWSSVDVTPLVTTNGAVSFALTTAATTAISLASREYGASFAPQLVVDTTTVAPSNTAPPTISGSAVQGQTLTADPGTWSGTPPISYAYQWRRCDTAAASCVDIAGATASSYGVAAADVGSTLLVVVTASNSAGSASTISAPTAVVVAATTADPVIAAAGDIACPSAPVTTGSSCHFGVTSDLIANDPSITDVLTLGDNQYDCGDYENYVSYFDPTWGRFKSKMHPVPGNHEHHTAPGTSSCLATTTVGAQGYFDYFDGVGATTGVAGNRNQGYYSYNIGAWHLIALNSNCSRVSCAAGSAQETWLKNDLATHSAACTLAYWHHPRFSSGEHGDNVVVSDLWSDLYHSGADVVLNGHDHDYERFAPQNAQGALDPNFGIREFAVGTGGRSHYAFVNIEANSELRDSTTFGILKLTLHDTGFEWQFSGESGTTFTDKGSASCHGVSPDTSPPTTPTNVAAAAAGPTQVNLTWSPSSDDVGVAGYEIFRNGTLIGKSTTTSYSDATVQPATGYTYAVAAFDLASNVSPLSASTSVTTPGDVTPPTPPTNLSTSASSNAVQLSWSASTDNVGVTGYQIFRDGTQIATATSPQYTDTSVQPATTYSYTITATDAAGNVSPGSTAATVTTPSGTLSFKPVADTYVEADTATTNYGTSTQIIADNSPSKNLLLKFTVSGVNGRIVTSAKLRLYCVDPGPYGGDFRAVTDTTWDEATVNWNNAPAAAATSLGVLGAVASGNWYEVDVTPLITSDETVSIKATSTSSDGAHYSSREGANPPQLIVTVR